MDVEKKLQRGDRENRSGTGRHAVPRAGRARSAEAGNLLQPDVRQKAEGAAADQGGSGNLHDAGIGKAPGTKVAVQEDSGQLRTGMFNPDEAKYANGVVVDLPYPTDDVRLLTTAAVDALHRVFRPGFSYSKVEVMLLNLCQPGEYTDDLFAISQPTEATRVMAVLDEINGRWGRGTLRAAIVPSNPDWGMRREMMSQSYTTRLDQLWIVNCS